MQNPLAPNKLKDFFRYCRYLLNKNPDKFRWRFDVDHKYIQGDLCEGITDLKIYRTHLTFRPKLQIAKNKKVVIEFKDIVSIDIQFDNYDTGEMKSVFLKAQVSGRSNYFPLPLGWDYL